MHGSTIEKNIWLISLLEVLGRFFYPSLNLQMSVLPRLDYDLYGLTEDEIKIVEGTNR